jgi:hypothetical protein
MARNRIALFEGTAQVNLTLQEKAFNRDVGVNGTWWWEETSKFTALGPSDRKDFIWVLSGAVISIGVWQTLQVKTEIGRHITWFIRLSHVSWHYGGKLSVLSFMPKGEGKVSFPGGHFPGQSGFKNKDFVTWAPVEFVP